MNQEERRNIEYKKIWQMVKPSVRKAWFVLPSIFIFAILEAGFSVSEPYIFGAIVDVVVRASTNGFSVSQTFTEISPYFIAWGGILVFGTLFGASHVYATWASGNLQMKDLLHRWLQKIFALDIKRFEVFRSGELLKRIDKAQDGHWRVHESIVMKYLRAVLLFCSAATIGFIADWRLTLISLFPVMIIIGIGIYNLKKSEPIQDKINAKWEGISGYIGDTLANITDVKSYVKERERIRSVDRQFQEAYNEQRRINKRWAIAYAGYGGMFTFGRLLIFIAGTLFIIQGTVTLGVLIMFLGFINVMFGSVLTVVDGLPYLLEAFSRLNRISQLFYEVPDIEDRKAAKALQRVKGEVVFDGVHFSYKDGKQVLKDISFTIPDGKTFALIGESGAGKSTLAKMMLRFHDPQKGSILIDGQDIRDLTLGSLRKNVGLVMQENVLFHETILQNIKLAKPSASQKEIENAAKRAQAHNFIKNLPNGYQTVVGERGVKLSGGEKQRIAIARVFLEDPPILVLDEATSALDSKTERDLQAALREVMKNRTTIVIAHRLSTVMAADTILVMDKGRIVDQGTHQDLIKRDSLYRDYWEIQACNYV